MEMASNLDANNASFPKQAVGIGAYVSSLMEDIHCTKEKTSKSRLRLLRLNRLMRRLKSQARKNKIRGFTWYILDAPRFTASHCRSVSVGEDNLAMIIPGAILTGIGGFLAVGAWFTLISSWLKSGKTSPRWTKFATVFAVLLPGTRRNPACHRVYFSRIIRSPI